MPEPAEHEGGGAVEVVKQVQWKDEDGEGQTFALEEEAVEFVIENWNYCQQHRDQ